MLKPRVAQFKEPENFSILIVCEEPCSEHPNIAAYFYQHYPK
jgi:hypothetical protein